MKNESQGDVYQDPTPYQSGMGGSALDLPASTRGQRTPQIFRKLQVSEEDKRTLANTAIDSGLMADDFFDYSKVVVKKPWGYEYLIFQNDFVAVWILYIKKGFQTSMHSHPSKKTSITVLSGDAVCSTLENAVSRLPGEVMSIGKGVFHRTASVSDGGTIVMEIETPVNKRDLVRLKDDYGREKMGYETIEHMSLNLHNYNYISLIDPGVYYNVKKRFGNCSIQLVRIMNCDELQRMIESSQKDSISLLKGRVLNHQDEYIFDVGDTFGWEDVESCANIRLDGELEVIIVKKTDTMVRLSDFVMSYLKKRNLKDVFFAAGTSNAHLIDAVGRDTELRSLSLQTEHAVTLAAESYAKLTGKPGVVFISSGSSGTSALTGVANAWIDSTPLVIISGQSRPSELGLPGEQPLRQLANKELDIVNIVRSITKHAAVIRDPITIREELDRVISLAMEGRSGPTWLDIPIDIQGMNIDEAELPSFTPGGLANRASMLNAQVLETLRLLMDSRRPVILAGYGIRAADAQMELIDLAKALSIPVLTSRRGIDLVGEDFPLNFGRPGTYGQRAANFIVQNADLLISIGARLSLPLIGRNYRAFARAAKKVVVDIDLQELSKTTVPVTLPINADAGEFIREMLACLAESNSFQFSEWLERCQLWRLRFPPNLESKYSKEQGVNPYYFIEILADVLSEKDILVVDGGPSLDYVMQAFKVELGQRIISSPGLEHQGFAIPGSIGACLGSRGQRIICICEKKGLQLNIPELQTIVNKRLPIKIFIFNCRGNTSIQQVQTSYFGGRYVGSDSDGIIGSLNITKLGEAYKIPTDVIATCAEVQGKIESVLVKKAPMLCEVNLPEGQEVIPRIVFTVKPDGKWVAKPIEDMYPFLDRKEFTENMIIDPLDED